MLQHWRADVMDLLLAAKAKAWMTSSREDSIVKLFLCTGAWHTRGSNLSQGVMVFLWDRGDM